jgi:cyclic pyranopterin phosphate synthase
MSYKIHMQGYDDLRTLYQIDALHAWHHGQYFPPVLVEISPTHSCNQKCRYCYAFQGGQQGDRLEDDLLVRSFTDVADAGVKTVLVQGTGEPLLHKALPRAIEAGADRGLAIGLTTNGVLFNAQVQQSVLGRLHYVLFSVVDIDAKRYAHMHGCDEKQHKLLIDNIELATQNRRQRDLSTAIWSTVYLYQDNFHDAYAIVKQCKEMGLDYVTLQEATFTELSPTGRAGYASELFSNSEIEDMKARVLSLADADFRVSVRFPLSSNGYCKGIDKNNWLDDHCNGVNFYSLISSDGNVYPCWRFWGNKNYSYGNLKDQSFDAIWRNEKRRNEIRHYLNRTPPEGDECKVCNLTRLNDILFNFENSNTRWKGFIT